MVVAVLDPTDQFGERNSKRIKIVQEGKSVHRELTASLRILDFILKYNGKTLSHFKQVVSPFSGDISDPEMEHGSPVLQADSLLSEPSGKPTTL